MVLALGISGDVLARPNDPDRGAKTVEVSVTVARGACAITGAELTTDFGEFAWNGSAYTGSSAHVKLTTDNTLKYVGDANFCSIGVRADRLSTGHRKHPQPLWGSKLTLENPRLGLTTSYQKWYTAEKGANKTHESDLSLSLPTSTSAGNYSTTLYFQASSGQG